MCLIHRLVAEAYIPNSNNLPEINHRNECREQNYINNLEWCDRIYNNNYGSHNERVGKALGKLVYCIELDRIFESASAAGRELGLFATSISRTCRGESKTCGGYHFQYLEQELKDFEQFI